MPTLSDRLYEFRNDRISQLRALIGTLVVVALVGFVSFMAMRSDGTPPSDPLAEASPVTPSHTQAATAAKPDVLVIGDSYTSGSPMNLGAPTWPTIIADREGWDLDEDGMGGTGYIGGGDYGQPFIQRAIGDTVDYKPDLIILAGGLNDRTIPVGEVEVAATTVVDTLKRAVPDADIVMLSPFGAGDPEPDILGVGAGLKRVADEEGIPFIDVAWMLSGKDARLIGSDGLHPIPAGHRLLADKIGAALNALGLPRPTSS